MTTTTPEPRGAMSVCRDLHDGARYELASAPGNVLTLAVRDADGDQALVGLDRALVRRLIEDLTLVGGLTPTAAKVDRAAALAGAFRRSFEVLAELDKTDPAAADQIANMLAAHLRSWRPTALVPVEVRP